MAKTGKL